MPSFFFARSNAVAFLTNLLIDHEALSRLHK